MNSARRQQGVALITAMLIMALLATLAAGLVWDSGLDVRRTMTQLYFDEGAQAALGAESWVSSILTDDAVDTQNDHFGEFWAEELPVLPIESDSIQGAIHGEIRDLQGLFNVNNLVDSDGEIVVEAVEQFQRLLAALELDPRFAGLAADWIDTNQDADGVDGAEDPIYTGMTPPYRTANQPLTSVTELAALQGMDKATFDILLPHIVALPGRTAINANTATAPVLQSLANNMSVGDVEGLLVEREDGGWLDTDLNDAFVAYGKDVPELLQATSEYFQLKVVVQIATVRITYYSVLHRSAGARGGSVVPILRSFGTI